MGSGVGKCRSRVIRLSDRVDGVSLLKNCERTLNSFVGLGCCEGNKKSVNTLIDRLGSGRSSWRIKYGSVNIAFAERFMRGGSFELHTFSFSEELSSDSMEMVCMAAMAVLTGDWRKSDDENFEYHPFPKDYMCSKRPGAPPSHDGACYIYILSIHNPKVPTALQERQ